MRNAATAVDTITVTNAGIRLSARCVTNLTIHSEEEMRREELNDTHQETNELKLTNSDAPPLTIDIELGGALDRYLKGVGESIRCSRMD